MNLIYYYPSGDGAPSQVSRKIIHKVLENREKVNVDKIFLFSKKKNIKNIEEAYPYASVLSWKDLIQISSKDIIHIPVLPTILPNSKFLLYIFSKIMNSRLILQYHGDVRTELKSSYKDVISLLHIFTYIFLPYLLKSSSIVITHSHLMNSKLTAYGVAKSIVIPNAVDNEWFNDFNNMSINIPLDERNYNIFYHGRLSWEKGVDLLIKALSSEAKAKKYCLYIAGEGPQKEDLFKICVQNNLQDNVVFLGSLSIYEIKFLLKSADVAIYPSRFDNFPLAVIEALAVADCPVYFSEKIGICDFVDKKTHPLNIFEVSSESIRRVISSSSSINSVDRLKIIRTQKDFAMQYTWDKIISKYIDVYNS